MKDISLKTFLNINQKDKQNRQNDKDNGNSEKVKEREELYLKYDAKEYGELSSNYSTKSKFDNRDLRNDGCIKKRSFENNYLSNHSVVVSALIDTVFIYIEKTRIPAYFDAYQENVGLDENLDMVTETLMYTQIQKLVFENANSYSYKKEPPLKKYFDANKSEIILRVLENYFLSVYKVFGVNFLYSSKAFRLMIEVFPELYDKGCGQKDLRYEFFTNEFENIAFQIGYNEEEFLENNELFLDNIYEILLG